jgi:hypothetical protein
MAVIEVIEVAHCIPAYQERAAPTMPGSPNVGDLTRSHRWSNAPSGR